MTTPGKLLGIATHAVTRAPMVTARRAEITEAAGVAGDLRGRQGKRQVTVLSREAWDDACHAVERDLPWTTRRANLLVEGVTLSGSTGSLLRVGAALLEITGETRPCERMEDQCAGLKDAMSPAWRGGVTCRVVRGGSVAVGDPVELSAPS